MRGTCAARGSGAADRPDLNCQ